MGEGVNLAFYTKVIVEDIAVEITKLIGILF